MNALKPFWTTEDKILVAEAIEKIFLLNDRSVDDDKKSLYVSEFERSGNTVYDVIKILDDMTREVVKSFKLGEVLQRIKEWKKDIKEEIKEPTWCKFCGGTGHITLSNGIYQYAFACTCQNGIDFANSTKSATWNGDKEQTYKGELLTLAFDNF